MNTYASTIKGHKALTDKTICKYLRRRTIISLFRDYRPVITKELMTKCYNIEKALGRYTPEVLCNYAEDVLSTLMLNAMSSYCGSSKNLKVFPDNSFILADHEKNVIFSQYLTENYYSFTSVCYH